MGMTMTEKILAKHAGIAEVKPGQLINCKLDMVLANSYDGRTKTMDSKWANLKKLEEETFAKIITGKVGIDAFDSFVEEWKASGGDEITKEVQEELDAQQ